MRIGKSHGRRLKNYLYEKLILTIRSDLGHKNRNLSEGDILALFVNGLDQKMKRKASQ